MSAAKFPRCQHIKVNGVQCGSPALRGCDFCYFHHNWRDSLSKHERPQGDHTRLDVAHLPLLEDGNSIQVALMQMMRMILMRSLDLKEASLVLYALQIAAVNQRHVDFNLYLRDAIVDPDHLRPTIHDKHRKLFCPAVPTATADAPEAAPLNACHPERVANEQKSNEREDLAFDSKSSVSSAAQALDFVEYYRTTAPLPNCHPERVVTEQKSNEREELAFDSKLSAPSAVQDVDLVSSEQPAERHQPDPNPSVPSVSSVVKKQKPTLSDKRWAQIQRAASGETTRDMPRFLRELAAQLPRNRKT